MPVHPNSLANLKPPWEPGTQPKPGARYIERMVNRGNQYAPQAIAVIGRIMKDPESHPSLQLRAAEYIVDKTWPKPPSGGGGEVTIGAQGAEWLDVRFHFPGSDTKPNGHAETVRVSFDAGDSGHGPLLHADDADGDGD